MRAHRCVAARATPPRPAIGADAARLDDAEAPRGPPREHDRVPGCGTRHGPAAPQPGGDELERVGAVDLAHEVRSASRRLPQHFKTSRLARSPSRRSCAPRRSRGRCRRPDRAPGAPPRWPATTTKGAPKRPLAFTLLPTLPYLRPNLKSNDVPSFSVTR